MRLSDRELTALVECVVRGLRARRAALSDEEREELRHLRACYSDYVAGPGIAALDKLLALHGGGHG